MVGDLIGEGPRARRGGRRDAQSRGDGSRRLPSLAGRILPVDAPSDRRLVRANDLGPKLLKGFAGPLAVWHVTGRVARQRAAFEAPSDRRADAAHRPRGRDRAPAAPVAPGARRRGSGGAALRASLGSASRASCASCVNVSPTSPTHPAPLTSARPITRPARCTPSSSSSSTPPAFARADPPRGQARQTGGPAGARHRSASTRPCR